MKEKLEELVENFKKNIKVENSDLIFQFLLENVDVMNKEDLNFVMIKIAELINPSGIDELFKSDYCMTFIKIPEVKQAAIDYSEIKRGIKKG